MDTGSQINYKNHWNKVYSKSEINKLGWYEEISQPSLDLIKKYNIKKNTAVLDVGSGTTTLIEGLIKDGYKNIIAVDISDVALEKSRERLKDEEAKFVKWIVDDITNPQHINKSEGINLWHDRTVLHFLTDEKQQQGYLSTLKQIVKPGGYVIIAVFSLEGAKKCSGLDVVNYNETMIANFVGQDFTLMEHFHYLYTQPSGGERPYVYTLFRRTK